VCKIRPSADWNKRRRTERVLARQNFDWDIRTLYLARAEREAEAAKRKQGGAQQKSMFEEPLAKRLVNHLATLFKSKQERILFMDLINNPVFQSMLLSLPYEEILAYVNRLIADLKPQDEDPPKADMPTVVEAEKSLATALVDSTPRDIGTSNRKSRIDGRKSEFVWTQEQAICLQEMHQC